MKKIILTLLTVLFGFNLLLKAQSSLGIDTNFLSYSYKDTTSFNNVDLYKVKVKNFGSANFSGLINVVYAVDSSTIGTSYVTLFIDSSTVNIPVGSTIGDSALISINVSAFRSGINTVVIWPRMSSTPFTTHDSLKLPVWVIGVAGIDNQTSSQRTIVFPNPMQQQLFVASKDNNFIIEQVRIFDSSGRLLYCEIFKGSIDVSKLTSGTYTLELSNKAGKTSRYKVIKE